MNHALQKRLSRIEGASAVPNDVYILPAIGEEENQMQLAEKRALGEIKRGQQVFEIIRVIVDTFVRERRSPSSDRSG